MCEGLAVGSSVAVGKKVLVGKAVGAEGLPSTFGVLDGVGERTAGSVGGISASSGRGAVVNK